MTNLRCGKAVCLLLVFGLLVLATTSWAQQHNAIFEKLAKTSPGDTWDLYLGKDNRIEAMVYHRGGPKKRSEVISTWAGYKKTGPLLVSTEHRGNADGAPLHIFFTKVGVKLVGSDKWMPAQ